MNSIELTLCPITSQIMPEAGRRSFSLISGVLGDLMKVCDAEWGENFFPGTANCTSEQANGKAAESVRNSYNGRNCYNHSVTALG